ncbi:MAG TPA: GNAT family N-acetyltransferase [Terriglobia bacterium]|nr:GNAT family N-acetyltransferase [Terriglobia bacterium]
MIEVCFLKSEELPIWLALRIEALAEAPGAFGDTVDQVRRRSPEEWRESLLDRDGALLLAYELGLPVGMARVSRLPEKPRSAGLYSMWVAPVARRKGVGKALMDAALVWAEQQKVDEMILFVIQGNAAKRLYLRAGFVETGRTVPLRSNPEIQMEEMIRTIR